MAARETVEVAVAGYPRDVARARRALLNLLASFVISFGSVRASTAHDPLARRRSGRSATSRSGAATSTTSCPGSRWRSLGTAALDR